MSPPVADKAPEILRSKKPWAAPAVNPIVRTTKRFLYLCNDEGRGESAMADRWAFFSSLLKQEIPVFKDTEWYQSKDKFLSA